jgi:hypothetical protein
VNVVNDMEDRRKLPKWTKEETDRVVAVFELLISMDKKQHPENYQKPKDIITLPLEN